MYWKSGRLMPALTSLYCGICRYFSNSASQAACDSGGTMPVTGCHSVIDTPDSVNRVMPPSTTMTKIIAQHTSSHTATGRELMGAAAEPLLTGACVSAVGKDTRLLTGTIYCLSR